MRLGGKYDKAGRKIRLEFSLFFQYTVLMAGPLPVIAITLSDLQTYLIKKDMDLDLWLFVLL